MYKHYNKKKNKLLAAVTVAKQEECSVAAE